MFFLPWWFAGSMNHSGKKRRRPQGRLRQGQAVSVVIAVATVVTILICSETDLLRPAPELKDIQPGPVAVGSVDEAAVVDLEVDNRGFVYATDRNGSGLDILELRGRAKQIGLGTDKDRHDGRDGDDD